MTNCEDLDRILFDSALGQADRLTRLANLSGVEQCIIDGFRRTSGDEDWDPFEAYLWAAVIHPSAQMTGLLCLVLDRHDQFVPNEDLLEVLAAIGDPDSVGSIERALHWYPPWDEFFAIAIKCVWALAEIGTDAAIRVLVDAALNAPASVRDWASSKLHHLEDLQ